VRLVVVALGGILSGFVAAMVDVEMPWGSVLFAIGLMTGLVTEWLPSRRP